MNATCSDCNQNVAYLIDMKCINCIDNIYYDEEDDEYEYCFEDQASIDLDEEENQASIDLDEEEKEESIDLDEESIDLDEEEKEENNKKVIDIEAITAAAMSVASAAMAAMVAASKCDEPKTCSICLSDIDGKNNNMTTDCGHCFHTKCFLQNVSHNGFACPNCRNQIIEEPECESDDDEDEYDDEYDDEYEEDEEDDEENEDVDDFDYALRGMRWMFERVDYDSDDDDYDDDESIDDETFERIQYERGHARFSEGNMQPLSLSTISERIRLQGITYDDLIALIVFPHKDNAEDIATYPHTRLMDIHSKVKDILEGSPMPVIEFSAEEANGKPLTLEDLTVDPSLLETIFDL